MEFSQIFIIKYAPKRVKKDYANLPPEEGKRVDDAFESLKKNPYRSDNKHIKKLKGEFKGSYRWDVNSLRIIYDIDKINKTVYIKVIDYRGQAYK